MVWKKMIKIKFNCEIFNDMLEHLVEKIREIIKSGYDDDEFNIYVDDYIMVQFAKDKKVPPKEILKIKSC